MAYVILTANGDEVDRRELTGPITIGRAQDADVPVRDILLSRKHCRIERLDDGTWMVTDLGSKNGTYLGYRQVTRQTLKDGDELRIGRTRVTFRGGAFQPAPAGAKRRDMARPADPTEALAGTVAGFTLVEPGEVERESGAPVPQPRPPEPTAFAAEDVYGMLNEIASSSWDSIKEQASRPLVMERPLPRPSGYRETPTAPVPVPRRTRVALSLQAPVVDPAMTTSSTQPEAAAAAPGVDLPNAPPARRGWMVPSRVRRQIAVGLVSIVATALLVGAWIIAVNGGSGASAAGRDAHERPPQPAVSADQVDIMFPALPSATRRLPSQPAPAPQTTAAPSVDQPVQPAPPVRSMPPKATLQALARVAALQLLLGP